MSEQRELELIAHVGSQPYSVVLELVDEIKKMREDRDFYKRAFKLLSKTRKKDCPYCVWHKDLGKSEDIRTAR